jgi:hypothetical protein
VDIFDWLSDGGLQTYDYKQCCKLAARKGHLSMLAWLRQNGKNNRSARTWYGVWGIGCESVVCVEAASSGRLGVLEWARGVDCGWDVRGCFMKAAHGGHVHVMRWMREQDEADCPWDVSVCDAAASGGNLPALQWVRGEGCPWHVSSLCFNAGMSGNEAMLAWLTAEGCEFDMWTAAGAARKGRDNLLLLLQQRGSPFDETACVMAAEGGHLGTLQWLREQGCPWGVETCDAAAEKGHVAVLRWAFEEGCPFDCDNALELAEMNARFAVLNTSAPTAHASQYPLITI